MVARRTTDLLHQGCSRQRSAGYQPHLLGWNRRETLLRRSRARRREITKQRSKEVNGQRSASSDLLGKGVTKTFTKISREQRKRAATLAAALCTHKFSL